jgi:hypothetical protein
MSAGEKARGKPSGGRRVRKPAGRAAVRETGRRRGTEPARRRAGSFLARFLTEKNSVREKIRRAAMPAKR